MQYQKTDTKYPKFLMNSRFTKGWKDFNRDRELEREQIAQKVGIDFDAKNFERE